LLAGGRVQAAQLAFCLLDVPLNLLLLVLKRLFSVLDFSTLKAYRWLLENQSKFEKEVFGPPIVTCSITDPKYADAWSPHSI
jgi:hypothetical protein